MRLIWIHILSHIDDFKINKFTIHVSGIIANFCLSFRYTILQCWGTHSETRLSLYYTSSRRFCICNATKFHSHTLFSVALLSYSIDWCRIYLARDSLEVGRWTRLICVCVGCAHTLAPPHTQWHGDWSVTNITSCDKWWGKYGSLATRNIYIYWIYVVELNINFIDCLRIDCCIEFYHEFHWNIHLNIVCWNGKDWQTKLIQIQTSGLAAADIVLQHNINVYIYIACSLATHSSVSNQLSFLFAFTLHSSLLRARSVDFRWCASIRIRIFHEFRFLRYYCLPHALWIHRCVIHCA